MSRDDVLFYPGDLDATLRAHSGTLATKVDEIPVDQFMNSPEEDLVEHVVAQMEATPLELHEDRSSMDQRELRVDVSRNPMRNMFNDRGPILVPGIEVTVRVPFTGDAGLWKLKPNHWQTVFPHGEIQSRGQGGNLVITLSQPADENPENFKSRLDQELQTVRFYVEAQRNQIADFNAGLDGAVRSAVKARRERVMKHSGLQDLLGIPLARSKGAPSVAPIPMERKLVRPLPPPPKSGYKAEPGITDADYEHILSVIRHEGRSFEATPTTYAVHGEEDLRNMLLAHLNGHYRGDATGETFRRSGKTDIRIEADSRAAFVAECKVWQGPSELAAGIDQLLSYLTWRDCKTAVVVFNKHNKKFSGILSAIPSAFEGHPNYRKTRSAGGDGEWQFSMSSMEDEGRLLRVHVFAFNIYSA